MILRLSPRLDAIYALIPRCDMLCDCGCDHGKIVVKAVLEQKCVQAFAIDVSAPSLNKAKTLAAEYGVDDKIEFSVADGLSLLEKKVDVCVIAGMGTPEIIKILDNAACEHEKYILLPHNYPHRLRKYLAEKELYPEYDKVIEDDGKFYHLMMLNKRGVSYDKESLYVGRDNQPDDETFAKYTKKRIAQLELILKYSDDAEALEEYQILSKYREV